MRGALPSTKPCERTFEHGGNVKASFGRLLRDKFEQHLGLAFQVAAAQIHSHSRNSPGAVQLDTLPGNAALGTNYLPGYAVRHMSDKLPEEALLGSRLSSLLQGPLATPYSPYPARRVY